MVKGSFAATVRHELWTEHGWRCGYCGKSVLIEGEEGIFYPDYSDMTMDHIVPKSQGGSGTRENLRPSCRKCNNIKSDMSLEKFRRKFFYGKKDQRFQYERWEDHVGEIQRRERVSQARAD